VRTVHDAAERGLSFVAITVFGSSRGSLTPEHLNSVLSASKKHPSQEAE
jgi:hypothetical protein